MKSSADLVGDDFTALYKKSEDAETTKDSLIRKRKQEWYDEHLIELLEDPAGFGKKSEKQYEKIVVPVEQYSLKVQMQAENFVKTLNMTYLKN